MNWSVLITFVACISLLLTLRIKLDIALVKAFGERICEPEAPERPFKIYAFDILYRWFQTSVSGWRLYLLNRIQPQQCTWSNWTPLKFIYLAKREQCEATDSLRKAIAIVFRLDPPPMSYDWMGHHTLDRRGRRSLRMAQKAKSYFESAIHLFSEVTDHFEFHQGVAHINTIESRTTLALIYLVTNNRKDALRLLRRVLEDCQRELGENHPISNGARRNLERLQILSAEGNDPRLTLAMFLRRNFNQDVPDLNEQQMLTVWRFLSEFNRIPIKQPWWIAQRERYEHALTRVQVSAARHSRLYVEVQRLGIRILVVILLAIHHLTRDRKKYLASEEDARRK